MACNWVLVVAVVLAVLTNEVVNCMPFSNTSSEEKEDTLIVLWIPVPCLLVEVTAR